MSTRRSRISIILAFVCIGFIVGFTISFIVPYQKDEAVLIGSDLGILDGLTVPFHSYFPWRSYNQSLDIFLDCRNGSLDILVFKSSEWTAWHEGENYSAYYEARNVTSVTTTVEISPQSIDTIDIILQTNYGDVRMNVNIISHCLEYDESTGVNSLLVAIPFGWGSFHYASRKSKNDDNSIGLQIS